jgi:CheY-like chemotaxis protein
MSGLTRPSAAGPRDENAASFEIECADADASGASGSCAETSPPAPSMRRRSTAASASEPAPSLLVLDVMMPGTDGLELLRRLRAGTNDAEPAVARLATLPVVLLTARGFASEGPRRHSPRRSTYDEAFA